ncbi:CRISPR-associated endoribonuclease Cas6, partial [Persephonella sp.]
MRICITLKSDRMPVLYRHRIVSLIKEALKQSDKDYKDFLYNGKITKPFSFNIVFPKERKIKKELIQIDSRFQIEDTVYYFNGSFLNLYISSLDYRFIISLFNGLKRLKTFDFSSGENMLVNGEKITLELKKVLMLNERPIKSDTVVFKTNSPILIEDKDDKPGLFSDKDFEHHLNEVTDRILKSPHIKGKGLEKPLKFEPIKMKKQV